MIYLLILLFCSTSLFADRIESLLAIGDAEQALVEIEIALQKDPLNRQLERQRIVSLAKKGDITALLKAYKSYNDPADRELLENVAWAVIYKASKSASPIIRQEATIAGFLTQDAKGIPICLKSIGDESEGLRLIATSLASRCRDEMLKERVLEAVGSDASRLVRLQAIEAVGSMRYDKAKEMLYALLENRGADAQEKMLAVVSLSNITQKPDPELLDRLVKSERASTRLLACELVLHHYDKENVHKLFDLMTDTLFDVRLVAIQTVAALKAKPQDAILDTLLSHPDIKTKILANWLSLIVGYKEKSALAAMQQFLTVPDRTIRLFAAGAVSHIGNHIRNHIEKFSLIQDDPLVALNLAIGAIWARYDVERAARHLLHGLKEKTRLSWHSMGTISYIGPATTIHSPYCAQLPESEDLLVRLELYSMLAACETIPLEEPLKAFLKERTWGISAQSACLMMQEGLLYEDALRGLLNDTNQEIALQAAFILAFYHQDDEALNVLMRAYNKASRQMKEYILFAVATIGTKEALPFLVEVLNEPFETLRVRAARGILICLYH